MVVGVGVLNPVLAIIIIIIIFIALLDIKTR
jgi:hypothetical protein